MKRSWGIKDKKLVGRGVISIVQPSSPGCCRPLVIGSHDTWSTTLLKCFSKLFHKKFTFVVVCFVNSVHAANYSLSTPTSFLLVESLVLHEAPQRLRGKYQPCSLSAFLFPVVRRVIITWCLSRQEPNYWCCRSPPPTGLWLWDSCLRWWNEAWGPQDMIIIVIVSELTCFQLHVCRSDVPDIPRKGHTVIYQHYIRRKQPCSYGLVLCLADVSRPHWRKSSILNQLCLNLLILFSIQLSLFSDIV